MSRDNNNRPRIFTPATSLMMSTTGPFLLICVLALGGVHITWWMIALAALATVSILVSAIRAAIRENGKPNDRGGKDGGNDDHRDLSAPIEPVQTSQIEGFSTSASGKRHSPITPLRWVDPGEGKADIVIDPFKYGQTVLGFGAALTGSACAVLHRMPADKREAVMEELFAPYHMNLNVNRISMGSSDYHPELYSYCDNGPDPEMTGFSIDKDRPYILPVLKQAQAISGDMFYLASPWSPPAWIKPNNTMLGGEMGPEHFDAYAKYFVKFIEAYWGEGINVNAVTVQNEVEADQGGKMPACTWSTKLEVDFVKNHLGPALWDADFHGVSVWMMDHNYDMEVRAVATLDDEQLRPYIDGIAWHGYGGDASAVGRVHDAHPSANHYFTEFNTFIDAPQYLTDWTFWGKQIGEAMRNWCRSYTMWNVALDEHGKPNIGPFTCGGVVTIDSQTGEVTRSGGYWGLGHYSLAVRRGALRIDSTGDVKDVTHVAFFNPDGEKVLVLSNSGAERTVTIEYQGQIAEHTLEADSVTTLTWL